MAVLVPAYQEGRGSSVPPTQRIERTQICLAQLDYDCATRELDAAQQHLAAMPTELQVAYLRLRAEVAMGSGRPADRQLRALLERAPAFDGTAYGWHKLWRVHLERVRAGMPDRRAPRLKAVVPAAVVAGQPARVVVVVMDRSLVTWVHLFTRSVDDTLHTVEMKPLSDGRYEATIEGAWVAPPQVAYWAEAYDEHGNGPGRLGHRGAPLTLPVAPRPVPPVAPPRAEAATRGVPWWGWALIGVGIAGVTAAAVAGGLAAAPANSTRRTATVTF